MSEKKKIPTYIVEEAETFNVSLVSSPAIEENFLLFNKQEEANKPILKFADEEKHLVVGAVMIPDKPIYRIGENGEEYNLVFSKEAIEGMAIDFMKNYRQFNVTIQHEQDASGIWLVEQWIKSDLTNDKSVAIGLNKDLPVGTLFQSYYCDSNELWQKLKDGEMRGFSIEAMCDFSKIEKQFNNQSEENKTGETNTIEPIQMEDMEAQEQPTVVEQTQETVVETPTVEEQAPVAEQTQEDVVETEQQETVVEQPKQEEVVEQPKEDAQSEVIKNLLEEIKSLKEQINDLSIKPSTKPVNVQSGGTKSDTFANWRKQMQKYL